MTPLAVIGFRALGGRPGLALVALSVIEQRYRAVMAVLDGAAVTEIAAEVGVSRQSVNAWVARYREAGLAGLADRSRRPRSSPGRVAAEVEARVCELRRAHPRWGAQRIVHELMRAPVRPEPMPSRATVHRILVRHGLVVERPRRKRRSEYVRWQRPAAMQLWQLDIVYGPMLVDMQSGELREARIVTGVDDHSRYCVLARVVERATGRAVCLAFAEALKRHGAPEEVLTDNGKQFTGRFGRGGEVLERVRRARGRRRRRPDRGRGRADLVRPRRPAVGQPDGLPAPVLARPRAGRADGAFLGQRRRHPPHDRRRPRQEPALALQHS